MAIKQCRSSGIDCKIHGLSILGRIRAEDEDLAAVPFLASDNEEEEDDKANTVRYGILKQFIFYKHFCNYTTYFIISNLTV